MTTETVPTTTPDIESDDLDTAVAGLIRLMAALEPDHWRTARPTPIDNLAKLPIRSVIGDAQGDVWVLREDGWHLFRSSVLAYLMPEAAGEPYEHATATDVMMGQSEGDEGFGPFHLLGLEATRQ